MSFVCLGVTHCSECMSPIPYGSIGCLSCKEKEEKKKQEKIDRILDIFSEMNDYEIVAFKEIVKEKSIELRKTRIKKI